MTRIPGMNVNDADGSSAEEEPQTLSLLGGVAGGTGMSEAELLEADSSKRGAGSLLSQTGLVIIVVAVIAAGSLYAMRLTQGDLAGQASTEAESKIENWLIRVQNPKALPADSPLLPENRADLFSDTDSILAMFQNDQSRHQVPVAFIKKNPFVLPGNEVNPVTGVVDTSARDRAKRMEELNKELNGYGLDSVMSGGARSIAVVDGEFYQVGEKIGSFTVESMDPMSVQLIAEGERFLLTIEGGDTGSKRR